MSGFPKNKTWKLSRPTYAAKTKDQMLNDQRLTLILSKRI
jgi:hypothetical protein